MDTKRDGSSWEPGADTTTPWMKQTAKESLLHGAGAQLGALCGGSALRGSALCGALRLCGARHGKSPRKPMDGWFIFLHGETTHHKAPAPTEVIWTGKKFAMTALVNRVRCFYATHLMLTITVLHEFFICFLTGWYGIATLVGGKI